MSTGTGPGDAPGASAAAADRGGTGEAVLLCRVDDGVATLTLNQPARLNPLSLGLQQALRATLAALRDDAAVRALVITGAGRAFCVGADLSSMQASVAGSLGARTEDAMREVSNPLILDLRALPMPTLAVLNGPAAGAGVGLALACDVVLAARSAYLYLPFAPRLGIVPDLGTTWFAPRFAGRARASGMALLDQRVTADQAAAWGLIWASVEDAELAGAARETAARLAALPPGVALEVRRAHDAAEGNDLAAQLRFEASRQRELIDGEAFAEGVRAFLEKRPPRFPGRAVVASTPWRDGAAGVTEPPDPRK